MNYRERMKKAVECPQFGNIDYGEWGSLNLIQRKDIKRLLDEMDRADEYIKTLYFKNENLQSKIDKAIDLLETFKSNSKDVGNEWAVEICELSIRKLKEK